MATVTDLFRLGDVRIREKDFCDATIDNFLAPISGITPENIRIKTEDYLELVHPNYNGARRVIIEQEGEDTVYIVKKIL